ncbi:MAG: hypothetical protein BGO82_13960 [Devosia sp. 67-54]|uniref:ABC transporter substrate-binding protein n=1 Tax=unclassified Devosia TaxID=196773 RepID=UPI0009688E8C|nr:MULTISPECIES: ABC transporter substrate-binding protein [unclassified Devosia]MBN9306725.1 ABC transporter substrate-binding protein [Devosia sp.]OJX15991.1 MAG: hypothetical protein BGO82_13960 [Devosia sp. 67-54]
MRLTRRNFMLSAASAAVASPFVIRPGFAQSSPNVIRSKVIASLSSLDPIWTTAYITRNHGYMIFDTLFSVDEGLNVKPQMVDSFDISADQLTYTFALRDGLRFHDGAPVTSADVIASIQRWSKKDNLGLRIGKLIGSLTAVDARTVRLELTSPFSLLLQSLGKASSNCCFIMPERLAQTDVATQVTEMIGSGPFTFSAGDYVPGSKAVYVRNADYKPRQEPPSGTSGGKVVKVDRVEWLFMDDVTATNAMQSGELDYFEEPSPELLPVLGALPGVTLDVTNKSGVEMVVRPNHTAKPFDNPDFRAAFMRMLNPVEHLTSYLGDPKYFTVDGSVYPVGTPYHTDAGVITFNPDEAKELLAKSGYNNEPIVVLQATDIATNRIFSTVTADQLRRAGLNVQVQASDFSTMFARALKNDPIESGNGWHMIHFANIATDMADPITSRSLSGAGDYLGWAKDEKVEQLRTAFLAEGDIEKRKPIAADIQVEALQQGFIFPGGTFYQPHAYTAAIKNVVSAPVPIYWGMEKTA